MAMMKPIAGGTQWCVLSAASDRLYHGHCHFKLWTRRTSSPRAGPLQTEARQSLHKSGEGAAKARELLRKFDLQSELINVR